MVLENVCREARIVQDILQRRFQIIHTVLVLVNPHLARAKERKDNAPAIFDDVVIYLADLQRCQIARGPHESGDVYETRLRAKPRLEGEDAVGISHRSLPDVSRT